MATPFPWRLAARVAAAALGGAAAVAGYSFLVEPAWIEVSRYPLLLPNLPAEWRGRRVVHLTDLHYGNPASEWLFQWMVERVNAEKPDLILMTGDFLLDCPEQVEPCLHHLVRLEARWGKVAVLGDHDFDRDLPFYRRHEPGTRSRPVRTRVVPGLVEGLEAAGVILLRNATCELPGGLHIAGVEPMTNRVNRCDLDRALEAAPEGAVHLLLSHAPDVVHLARRRGIRMQLSGHTHGGQIVVPGYGPPITNSELPRAVASGWSLWEETQLFTSRGLSSHYSLRFFCRPEMTVFTVGSG
ncbi:MAG: hypothetical protein FJ315_07815 [SAR202 cluster bacterium]|nr:hypothetical protein [SAR202 cluster bacterium]